MGDAICSLCGQASQISRWPRSSATLAHVRGALLLTARRNFSCASRSLKLGCLPLYARNADSPSLHSAAIDAPANQSGSGQVGAPSTTTVRYHAHPSTILAWTADGAEGRRSPSRLVERVPTSFRIASIECRRVGSNSISRTVFGELVL
jgi:hypothetical protein